MVRTVKFLSALVFAACSGLLVPIAASAPGQLTDSSRVPLGSEEVTARFTRRMDPLIALFESRGGAASDTFIDSLIANGARADLFRMESLLRLYRRKFPNLTPHLLQVKAVEDGLGAYSYAVDSLNFAKDRFKNENSDQEKILEGLEKKRAAAHVELQKLLDKSTLAADLTLLRSQVGPRFGGWGAAKDMPFVKTELQKMLRKVRDEHYDFTKLEDGIHKYRRQLRWFPMTIDGLDGLVVVRDDPAGACPVPGLEALAGSPAARSKYANPPLTHPAPHPCALSRCLLWQVSKAIGDLGRLKDTAQGNLAIEAALDDDLDVATSNAATPEETARAAAIRTELNSSHALDALLTQVSSCK